MLNFDRNKPKENIGGECIEEIRKAIIDNKITASGATQRSLNFTDTVYRLVIFREKGGAPIKTLQYGREGGKVPKGFVGIIAQWIIDKGIKPIQIPYKTDRPHKYTVEERSRLMLAGAIAHKIKDVGTDRHRNNRNDIYTPALERAKARFVARWRENMKEVVINTMLK